MCSVYIWCKFRPCVSSVWSYLLTHKKSPWASRSPIGQKSIDMTLANTTIGVQKTRGKGVPGRFVQRKIPKHLRENKSEAVSGFSHERICALCCPAHPPPTFAYRGRILGRHWDKSLQSLLLPCYSQSPLLTDFPPCKMVRN
jgi:hypothetical protein